MKLLEELLSNAANKMAAFYKHNPGDKSPTSLLKGLQFNCDNLSYTITGNQVQLFDSNKPAGERYVLDATNLIAIDTRRKDSYGAVASKIYVGEDIYHFQYA